MSNATYPPLFVNGHRLVKNLKGDYVDGLPRPAEHTVDVGPGVGRH